MITFDPRDNSRWNFDPAVGFTAFASDAFGRNDPPNFFKFVNSVTGTQVYMKLDTVERDPENDIRTFVYRCSGVITSDPKVDVTHVSRCMARVFND